jgi:hypothetical protein
VQQVSSHGTRWVGEIGLDDLAAVCRSSGQDGLPYPLGSSLPRRQHNRSGHDVDLNAFREWTDAYVAADIWISCRVHYSSDAIPDRRIFAHRAGDAGFLASQHGNDVIVSAMSGFDLGVAVAGSVGLTESGAHQRVVVPGYVGYFAEPIAVEDSDDDSVRSVRIAAEQPSPPAHSVVADEAVTAIATIQSRWQPARRWGMDWTKNLIACVHADADGDYIYAPDFSHAVPVTEQALGERIERLIAEDITALRRQHGLASHEDGDPCAGTQRARQGR